MSFINKGTRVFDDSSVSPPRRIRSEFRMKEYHSADDLRTWCDDVEQRRQQILDYQAKNRGSSKPCPEKIVPLEALFNEVLSMKDVQIKDLEKDVERIKKTIKDIYKRKLTAEQKKKFDKLKAKVDEEFPQSDSDDD